MAPVIVTWQHTADQVGAILSWFYSSDTVGTSWINKNGSTPEYSVFFPTADCIANYGNHGENKQGSETAIYSDVNLSNKINEIKTFPNSTMCYASPGGDSAATYEPIPYATTQLIQANIKNKAATVGGPPEPLDIPCWKQPPNLPPIPKEMAAQMQYSIIEQNILEKGKLGFNLIPFCLKIRELW